MDLAGGNCDVKLIGLQLLMKHIQLTTLNRFNFQSKCAMLQRLERKEKGFCSNWNG